MQKHEIKYIILIIIAFMSACIETDIFLPALADMMEHFGSSEEEIQQLLSWNFIGICLSGPIYGPLSDAIGRRRPLLAALALFFLGSLMTLWGDGLNVMLMGRLLQGIGSGGCFTLGTAIIFDVFKGDRAISVLNRINAIVPFIMAAAPLIGGFLNLHFGFRSNFLAIASMVLCALLACLFGFKESLPEEKQAPLSWMKIKKDFTRAFSCGPFWLMTLVISLCFAGYMAFLSTTALLFVVEYGISRSLAPFFQGAILGTWFLASLLFDRAQSALGQEGIKRVGTLMLAIGGGALLLVALVSPRNPHLLTATMMVYTFGFNWSQAIIFPEGMELLPDIKGVTASLLTSARLLITALVIDGTAALYNGTVYPLAGTIAGIVLVTLLLLVAYQRRQKSPSLQAL